MANVTDTLTDVKKLVRAYCDYLLNNDYDQIMQLFAAKALVQSPLGEKDASAFYFDLFNNSKRTCVEIIHLFCDAENPYICAAYLDYKGQLKNKDVQFNCVDIFEFDDCLKIKKLTIIWGTYPVRAKVDSEGI